ncbi:MAG: hypothetical protein M1819_005250 [Sarea resinae]|nr:MAG: hypothetical protein M1819_005250 [Sarea resinae]
MSSESVSTMSSSESVSTISADAPLSPPTSPSANEQSSAQPTSPGPPPRLPVLRSVSDSPAAASMTASSTPLGTLNAARRPAPQPPLSSIRAGGLPQDMQARMKAFHLSRQGAPPAAGLRAPNSVAGPAPTESGQIPSGALGGAMAPPNTGAPPSPGGAFVGGPGGLRLPPARPHAPSWSSAPAVPHPKRAPKPSLGARRGMALPGGLPGALPPTPQLEGNGVNGDTNKSNGEPASDSAAPESNSLFNKFSEFVDTKAGTLKFAGKAVIHSKGVDFSSGSSFKISLDEVDTLDELGKGNYGTVYKVRHSRPQIRRPGLGLKGNRAPSALSTATTSSTAAGLSNGQSSQDEDNQGSNPPAAGGVTGIIMAMKEIRLELDEAKFAAIIMELDILHRCISPFIVDFYGAFFQEGAVYICMEFMDGGSIDKLYGDGIPENVLRKITFSTLMGLKTLKDEHNIIHRDVKPTNILINTRGQIKICDFGVSGNLVASIAKTNIGCQSYMAPERIASGGVAQAGANPGGGTYSVQSDIWSLGLTVIECAMGRYPYPPETYNNIFSQLSAIVDGEPPDLPAEGFSDEARDFVRGCLHKIPKLRPTYAMLLRHPWIASLIKPPTISEEDEDAAELPDHADTGVPDTADKEVAEWVIAAVEARRNGSMFKKEKPALHAVALDVVHSPSLDGATDAFGALSEHQKVSEEPKGPEDSKAPEETKSPEEPKAPEGPRVPEEVEHSPAGES